MVIKEWLRLLIAEDSEDDAAMLLRQLGQSFQVDAHRVETEAAFKEALYKRMWDCVITDYVMPGFSGMDVLDIVRNSGLDLPVIVVSGVIGEEAAVSAMKAGASDYILKANPSRLVPAVERMLRDAAERRMHKIAQERLRLSERKFDNLLESLPAGIIVMNMDKDIIEINQVMVDMFGYGTKEEVRDAPRDNLYVDPEDRQNLYEQLAKSASAEIEAKMRRKYGAIFWASITSAIKTIGGADSYIISIFQDISERKFAEAALLNSEERFRQIFEQNEDAMFIVDGRTMRIIDVNPAFVRLYGFTGEELAEGGTSLFISTRDCAGFEEQLYRTNVPKGLRIERMSTIRKDGERIVASIRWQRICFEQSDVTYCTIRDITERVRLQEESRIMQSKLIQANKMASIGILSSGVAHEINNPNNFILSNSSILAAVWGDVAEILEEYYRENGEFSLGGVPYTEMRKAAPGLIMGISDGARRVKRIIDDMKTLARPDKDEPASEADVNQAVRAAASLLKHQIDTCTRDWEVKLSPELPKVRGSTQKIEQVMINLIMNALQALTGSMSAVHVTTSYEEGSGCVLIKIVDDGIGIPPDVLPRLTEPFFTTRADDGGTGLGLAISYSIIQEHGGTMEFESGLGKGTAVYVRLPALFNAELKA